ncbi:DNA-3-methyladenine glycosylase 1-like [Malania oleifera]|uniref:DNA-3-methyladenine glycosylase 1-like n=1 Tax=Malania oleifera TaxID=397392 RepID=UPI0025AE64F9|nr:DNA-3-methyladenine glycosylase 1-like [Malania oleifera]
MGEQTQILTVTSSTATSTSVPSQKPTSSPDISSPHPKSRKVSSGASPNSSALTNPSTITIAAVPAGGGGKDTLQLVKVPPRMAARALSCEGELDIAIRHLRKSDPKLAPLIDAHEPPKFDNFDPPFLALAKSILFQQITRKAGTAVYNRFTSLCGGEARVCPISVLALTPHQLLQIGVSARKISFLHDLANKYRTGILSDSKIVGMEDKALVSLITMVKGFGALSVHMFMIFTLHRPDVLPFGDVNVRKGVQILYGLEQLPRPSQMERLCERWRPYRSVSSWYMWRLVEASGAQAKLEVAAGSRKQSRPPEIVEDGLANPG